MWDRLLQLLRCLAGEPTAIRDMRQPPADNYPLQPRKVEAVVPIIRKAVERR
jgi:hypothetical protein